MPSAAAHETPSYCPFVPHLRLRTETLLVDRGEGLEADYRPVDTAVIELSFAYPTGVVSASGPANSGADAAQRDYRAEQQARCVLEGYGPVDLACLEDCAPIPGSSVDYVVDIDGDPDVLVGFGATAIPALKALGWQVEVAADYPCHVAEVTGWYARVDNGSDDERDWFELELGVDVDGERLDLLPVLLEILDKQGGLESLAGSRRRLMALPLGGRRYIAVPPARLRAIAEVLTELYRVDGGPKNGKVRLPAFLPNYLEDLESALEDSGESIEWDGDPAVRRRARGLRLPKPKPTPSPRGLQATLRPYQEVGLAWMQNLRAHGAGGVLADDMGLGKTLQTISHIVAEKDAGRLCRPVLVVAPTSLIGNWKREIAKFAPSIDVIVYHGPKRRQTLHKLDSADVVITTYPLLTRDQEAFEQRPFYMMVLDEAHAIKNVRSRVHIAAKAVDAQHKLCLTGTPIENNLEELWGLFDFLMPGFLGDISTFRTSFRYPIERFNNEERLAVLRDRIAPFILRRLKDKVAKDLPPKTEIVRTVELTGDQRDLYESIRLAAHAAVRKAVRKKGVAASTIDILGALMKLRQVCCDPRIVPVQAAAAVEASAKFEALREMLTQLLAQGRRVLIFSQFTSMLGLIGDELHRQKVPYVSLTGGTKNRQEAVDTFQSGVAKVFLISLKAGGTGLNLTRADTVIHYDPWWNPAAQAQATDRAYRIGQTQGVFVYNLIVSGSVEERMMGLQRRKKAIADGLLAIQDGSQVELTEGEIDGLFAPLGEVPRA